MTDGRLSADEQDFGNFNPLCGRCHYYSLRVAAAGTISSGPEVQDKMAAPLVTYSPVSTPPAMQLADVDTQ